MQAIIMAAGKGTRMGDLTNDLPKPLFPVANRPMLLHTIDALPQEIDEVLLVVHYHADLIIKTIGEYVKGRKITYIFQEQLSGTASAVWVCRAHLQPGRFLVLGGDDWFPPQDIQALLDHPLTMGVANADESVRDINLGVDAHMNLTTEPAEFNKEFNFIPTGSYVIDHTFFHYPLESYKAGEFGLPHTMMHMLKDHQIKAVFQPAWLPMNTPEHWEAIKAQIEGRTLQFA